MISFTFYWFIVSRCKAFSKYFTEIHPGSRNNSNFQMEILLIFQFLTRLLLWSLRPCFRNRSHIPKSQTMLQILKVNFIWRLLITYLDWIRLNKRNGNGKIFFSDTWTFIMDSIKFSNCRWNVNKNTTQGEFPQGDFFSQLNSTIS